MIYLLDCVILTLGDFENRIWRLKFQTAFSDQTVISASKVDLKGFRSSDDCTWGNWCCGSQCIAEKYFLVCFRILSAASFEWSRDERVSLVVDSRAAHVNEMGAV